MNTDPHRLLWDSPFIHVSSVFIRGQTAPITERRNRHLYGLRRQSEVTTALSRRATLTGGLRP
jgi:hypothetical protein